MNTRPSPEHEELAVKIAQTWPRSAPVDIWAEDLADLPIGACNTAFVRQRRELTHAPTIADFRTVVRSLTTTDASNRPADCPTCDNTGWTPTPPHTHNNTIYTGVEPCPHCPEGRHRATTKTWTQSPPRHFITDTEAARLTPPPWHKLTPP